MVKVGLTWQTTAIFRFWHLEIAVKERVIRKSMGV